MSRYGPKKAIYRDPQRAARFHGRADGPPPTGGGTRSGCLPIVLAIIAAVVVLYALTRSTP